MVSGPPPMKKQIGMYMSIRVSRVRSGYIELDGFDQSSSFREVGEGDIDCLPLARDGETRLTSFSRLAAHEVGYSVFGLLHPHEKGHGFDPNNPLTGLFWGNITGNNNEFGSTNSQIDRARSSHEKGILNGSLYADPYKRDISRSEEHDIIRKQNFHSQ